MSGGEISGSTRVAAVIGWPIAHSLSPTIHNAGFASCAADWTYVALPVPPGHCTTVLDLVRDGTLGGLSITMPHKTDVFHLVDRVSSAAATLRSVNTIARDDDGGLVGHSTDGDGLIDALCREDSDPKGRSVLVLGWGGAGRSVTDALSRHGATRIVVSNRSGLSHDELVTIAPTASSVDWDDRGRVAASVDLVVNCTSVGMGGDANSPIDTDHLRPSTTVVDLVYHPLQTPLLRAAAERGCPTVGGLGMLIHQAARQQQIWLDRSPDVSAMTAAALRRLGTPPVA